MIEVESPTQSESEVVQDPGWIISPKVEILIMASTGFLLAIAAIWFSLATDQADSGVISTPPCG